MFSVSDIIKKIVAIEWKMFIAVNEGGERASCQEDPVTFDSMRTAQFSAWSRDALTSYLCDLDKALNDGRNLLEEKYIHMSKTTEPRTYEALLSRMVLPDETTTKLAHEISDIMLEQTRILFNDYPYVSGQGRPLHSALDYTGTSVETYQLGELLTYSKETLTMLKEHITSLSKEGKSFAGIILENTVKHYGYESLDSAETATREYSRRQGEQMIYRNCTSCNSVDCCDSGDCFDYKA